MEEVQKVQELRLKQKEMKQLEGSQNEEDDEEEDDESSPAIHTTTRIEHILRKARFEPLIEQKKSDRNPDAEQELDAKFVTPKNKK